METITTLPPNPASAETVAVSKQVLWAAHLLSALPVLMLLASSLTKFVIAFEILGPRDLSYSEATRILGERIGKPGLPYVQFSYADEARALVQAGLSESFAGLYAEMTRAFNEGRVKPQKGRTPANTTPTRFEDFAGELARAYAAAS